VILGQFMDAMSQSRERTGARLIDEGQQARGRVGTGTPWRQGRY
jgi:hypothetical protein